jgi:hypothetical protein
MADEIMQELWAAKDAIAEEAGYDLDRLCQLLEEWQTGNTRESPEVRAAQSTPEA